MADLSGHHLPAVRALRFSGQDPDEDPAELGRAAREIYEALVEQSRRRS